MAMPTMQITDNLYETSYKYTVMEHSCVFQTLMSCLSSWRSTAAAGSPRWGVGVVMYGVNEKQMMMWSFEAWSLCNRHPHLTSHRAARTAVHEIYYLPADIIFFQEAKWFGPQ
jgi:hypothetical protein